MKNDNFIFVQQDILNHLDIASLDRIYNLACPASPPAYQRDPIYTFKTSVMGIMNMLELSLENGGIPILQASTSEVYGDPISTLNRKPTGGM